MKRFLIALAIGGLLVSGLMAARQEGKKGVAYPTPLMEQARTIWDNEIDTTVPAGVITLTSGNFKDGTPRVDCYCRGLKNQGVSSINVYYHVAGDTGTYYVHLIEGQTDAPLRNITSIHGTGQTPATTAGAVIKMLFQDSYILNGSGPVNQ